MAPRAEPALHPELVEDGTRVGDVFHPEVITCRPESSVAEVARTMATFGVHAVVIIDDTGHAVGVVSQTDVVLAGQGRERSELDQLDAAAVMTPHLVTCTRETTVTEAVTEMTRQRIHRLVVVDETDGRPVPLGVVSMTDVVGRMVGSPTPACRCRDAY